MRDAGLRDAKTVFLKREPNRSGKFYTTHRAGRARIAGLRSTTQSADKMRVRRGGGLPWGFPWRRQLHAFAPTVADFTAS